MCQETVICGGDFNSHIGRTVELRMSEEEYEEEEDEVVNETVGKHRLNTPTAGKSKQFVEWLASRGLKHVDSHCTCGRRGTWWHGFAKKWYELDCFITNIPITPGRWSRLNTFTMDGADHRGKDIMLKLEMRPETKASRIKKFEEKEKEEQDRRRIRWDETRGRSQWAEDKKEEYRVALEDETPSWKELAEVVTATAEEICGRQPRSSDMKPEILRIRKCVADSYFKVQECRGQPNEIEERERHKGVKKWGKKSGKKSEEFAHQGRVLRA